MLEPNISDDELNDLIRKLIALSYREKHIRNDSKYVEQKIEIFNKIKELKTKKYKLSYNSNKVMVWDHPDHKGDKNYQIKYVMDPGSAKYRIESGFLANAVIINDQEVVEISGDKISHHGQEKQFSKIDYDWNKDKKNLYHIRQESIRRYNKKFQTKDFQVEIPFYIAENDIKRFEILKNQLSSDDKSKSISAYEEIKKISIPYDFVAKTIPYYDENGNLIAGFDEYRAGKRPGDIIDNIKINSKCSILYKLDRNRNFEFITSDLSSNFFILATKNPGTDKQEIELFEFFKQSDKYKSDIINYDPDHKLSCGFMCGKIRSGNALTFSIGLDRKKTEFIDKIYSNYLLQEDPIIAKIIIDILDDILSFDRTNALIKTYKSPLSIDELDTEIKSSIENIRNSKDYSVDNITKLFYNDINNWSSQERKKEDIKYTDKIESKKIDNIRVKNNYNLICKFDSNFCKYLDGSNYNGKVYLYSKYKDFDFSDNEHRADSFIIEINKEGEIRIRLGKGNVSGQCINIVDTEIQILGKSVYIKNNEVKGDKELLKETLFSEYNCNNCINHYEPENQELIATINRSQQSSQSR